MDSSHQLVWTHVMHQRRVAPLYRFRYRLFSLLLDLDGIPQLASRSRLFRFNRPGLLSFYERDHGPRDGTPLRPWIEGHLRRQGIDLDGGPIHLLCLPRVLGYGFNPLTLWYCHHRDGSLRAVLCEVHNTFGEHHGYLLHEGGRPLALPLHDSSTKCFHVSPFFDVEGGYRFSLTRDARRLSVGIRLERTGGVALVASQTGRLSTLTDRALLRALVRFPLAGLQITVAIHWQALKIWLRGARFHSKPQPPTQEVS